MKIGLFSVLLILLPLIAPAQVNRRSIDITEYGVRIEPDTRLIVVLASLEAAGVETLLTEKGTAFRRMLEADLAGLDPDLRERLRAFIINYRKRHSKLSDKEVISPFVSMAYSLTPVPDLLEPARASDLPGELLDVLDYSPLVREFYRKSNFGGKIEKYVKLYQEAGDGLRPSTSLMIGKLLDYLHTRPLLIYAENVKTESLSAKKNRRRLETTEKRERERRFFIVPELLAAKGTINFVNIGDDYYAIVPPETDLASSEVRRAYLQFVLDPIVLGSSAEIVKRRDAIKALLDERRKANPNISPDFVLAVSRSLVAAVDARQIEFERTRLAGFDAREEIARIETVDAELVKKGEFDREKRDALKREVVRRLNEYNASAADDTALMLSEAYESGALLAFYFNSRLKGLEDSGFDMTESIRNMIAGLDPVAETGRLAEVADARGRALAERQKRKASAAESRNAIENPVTLKLLTIDGIIGNKDYEQARKQLKKLLGEASVSAGSSDERSRVYYSLGRLESLSAEAATDADTRNFHLVSAKNAYDAVLTFRTARTDQAMISLTYVALARIYEFNDQNEYAIKIYEAAMKVGDIPGGAYKEAAAALDRLMKNQ